VLSSLGKAHGMLLEICLNSSSHFSVPTYRRFKPKAGNGFGGWRRLLVRVISASPSNSETYHHSNSSMPMRCSSQSDRG
jgi:hypothetical protein